VAAVLAAEAGQAEGAGGDEQVADWAARALARRYKQFRQAGKGFMHLDAAERHRLRITAKRLRYTAEGFVPLFGEKAERYLSLITSLQDGLGVANDMAVTHGLLAGLSHDRRQAHGTGLVEGFLASEAGQRAQALQETARAALRAKPFWA
jgi:CHAD domain-containing protein